MLTTRASVTLELLLMHTIRKRWDTVVLKSTQMLLLMLVTMLDIKKENVKNVKIGNLTECQKLNAAKLKYHNFGWFRWNIVHKCQYPIFASPNAFF